MTDFTSQGNDLRGCFRIDQSRKELEVATATFQKVTFY
jgi:hypothetical protein